MMECEVNQRMGAAGAMLQLLHFVASITCGHEGWGMTERTRSQTQVAEMYFLHWEARICLRGRMKILVIRERVIENRTIAPVQRKSRQVIQASGLDPTGEPP